MGGQRIVEPVLRPHLRLLGGVPRRAGPSQPLLVATSTDGGDRWTTQQVTPATNNVNSKNGFGRSGCTIRTDSHGVAYVFAYQFARGTAG